MKNTETDRKVLAWLAAHYGVISREEALAKLAGALPRGVPLGGSPMLPESRLRVGVLLGGAGCAVSDRSAAWLWGIASPAESIDAMRQVTITVPRRASGRVSGLVVVRSRHAVRVVFRRGLPCTEPIRTLIDCAAGATAEEVDSLVDRALARRIVRHERLLKSVVASAEFRHHRGRPRLVARFKARGVTGSPHPSVLESRMGRLLRRHRLPEPRAELWWGPDRRYRLDFAFPEVRLVIEVDGHAGHFAPEQHRYDRRRDPRLRRAGWTVLRYDWWEVTYDAARVAQEIAAISGELAAVA